MKIAYRQGILSKPTLPSMLYDINGIVGIRATDVPVTLTFTHGKRNYVYTIDRDDSSAWVIPTGESTVWLYWEIDHMTGKLLYGTTTIDPLGYGRTLPSNPLRGTHFFDHNDRKMKVWSGGTWVEKIRLIAGKWENGVINEQGLYTQAGLRGSRQGGYIVFDRDGDPVFNYDDDPVRTKYFSVDGQTLDNVFSNTHKTALDKLQLDKFAGEVIGRNKCLIMGDDGLVYVGSRNTSKPIIGISDKWYTDGDKVKIITDGFVVNREDWNWEVPENSNLFVDDAGNLTPELINDISSQIIAMVVSPNTIFVNIQEKITVLQGVGNAPTPTPSNTAQPSATPTNTPTVTPTNTQTQATPTVTPTNTQTGTPLPTPTPTPTASVLPPLTANLVSWWSMDEATGTRFDSHGSNDLPDTTTVAQTTGKVGSAAQFTSDHFSIPVAGTGIDGAGSFSVGGWVYFDELLTESKYVICRCKASLVSNADIDWQLIYSSATSNLTLATTTGTSFYYAEATSHGVPSTGTWLFMYAYYDALNGEIGISINDGTLDTTSGIPAMNSAGDTFNIGWLGAVAPRYFNGRGDEIFYYNEILSSAEVSRLYNSGAGIPYST